MAASESFTVFGQVFSQWCMEVHRAWISLTNSTCFVQKWMHVCTRYPYHPALISMRDALALAIGIHGDCAEILGSMASMGTQFLESAGLLGGWRAVYLLHFSGRER